jgi:hypothetical protein
LNKTKYNYKLIKYGIIYEHGNYINNKREGEWYEKNNEYEFFVVYVNDKMNGSGKLLNKKKELISEFEMFDDKIIKQKLYNNSGKCTNLPDGEIIVWKAGYSHSSCSSNLVNNNLDNNLDKLSPIKVYIKLRVPIEARRVTPFYQPPYFFHQSHPHYIEPLRHKGRVEYAYVDDIIDKDGNSYNKATSFVHSLQFDYIKKSMVKPDSYDDDPNNESSHGINVHLFVEDCDQWFTNKNFNKNFNKIER